MGGECVSVCVFCKSFFCLFVCFWICFLFFVFVFRGVQMESRTICAYKQLWLAIRSMAKKRMVKQQAC